MSTSQPDAPHHTSPTNLRQRQRKRWLIFATCLLLIAVAWYVFTPRPYRVIGRYQASDTKISGSTTGFVYREKGNDGNAYIMRNWTGGVNWRLQLNESAVDFALSPDGLTFAAYTKSEVVHIRQAGREWAIPISHNEQVSAVTPLNDGSVFVQTIGCKKGYLSLIQQGRVTARGASPVEGFVAPDGSSIVNIDQGYYWRITIKQQKIIFSHFQRGLPLQNYNSYARHGENCLGAAGKIIGENGVVYDEHGQVAAAAGWEHVSLTYDGMYVYQWNPNTHRARVYSPVTGTSWGFPLSRWKSDSGPNGYGIATQDGRHALFVPETMLAMILEKCACKSSTLENWYSQHGRNFYHLNLIEQPKRVRASLSAKLLFGEIGDSIGEFAISPDGKSLVFISSDTHRCVLFRW